MATVTYLVVAGGGGGSKGSGTTRGAGGGGAGGLLTGSDTITTGVFSIVVGQGGQASASSIAPGSPGSDSIFNGHHCFGGGAGSGADNGTGNTAGDGGSGGGAGDNAGLAGSGGNRVAGQGNVGGSNSTSAGSGGSGGGGGGSNSAGTNGSVHGATRPAGGGGTASSISGASVTYAAGGSGGEYTGGTAGGNGVNPGDGGGGGGNSQNGGNGANGIVILSYPTGTLNATGGVMSASGGNTIHTFSTPGTFSFIVFTPVTLIATQAQTARLATLKLRIVTLLAVQRVTALLTQLFPLLGLAPSSDRTAGGATVTLASRHFENGCTVTFGGVGATGVTFVSSNRITCTAPAHVAGIVDVVVTNPSGSVLSKTSAFTYYTPASSNTALAATVSGSPLKIRFEDSTGLHLSLVRNQPSTVSFDTDQAGIVTFAPIRIGVGSVADNDLLFMGEVQVPDLTHEGHPTNQVWNITPTDQHYRLKRRLAYKTYVNVSATAIAQDLIATYLSTEFTTVNVQAGLPTVTVTWIGIDVDTCLSKLAGLIGGYYYIQVADIHLFQGAETPTQTPDAVTDASVSLLNDPPVDYQVDTQPVRNRVNVTGGGSTIPTALNAGETIVPVDAADVFSGGQAITGAQVLSYTGKQTSLGGSLVGPGTGPSSAPSAARSAGTGLGVGTYEYAYTDVTGAGESLPSPIASVVTGTVADPTTAPSLNTSPAGNPFQESFRVPGETITVKYSYSTAASSSDYSAQTNNSPTAAIVVLNNNDPLNPTLAAPINYSGPYSTDPAVQWIFLWVSYSSNPGVGFRFMVVIPNNSAGGTWGFTDNGYQDFTTGQQPGSSNTAVFEQVSLAGIAIGNSPTTKRNLYRTVVNGSQLKLLTQIADNTTTTYIDSTPDGSLGANAPVSDSSGLAQPSGTVNAGSTTLLLAGAGSFSSTGGWALVGSGSQYIRYTGITGNTLTGIPAAGVGAIVASISYGATCTAVAALTGVSGLNVATLRGDTISLFVQVNSLVSQSIVAAAEGNDGVHEYPVNDQTILTAAGATVRGNAELAVYATPPGTLKYTSTDLKSAVPGRAVVVNLVSLSISGTFVIQQVDLLSWDENVGPIFQITASNVRFTIDDFIRAALVAQ